MGQASERARAEIRRLSIENDKLQREVEFLNEEIAELRANEKMIRFDFEN